MLYAPLFKKYQKSLLWLANSPGGREMLGIPFKAKNIVKIDRNSFTELISLDKKKATFRQTFYTRNKHLLILRNNMTFDYLEILNGKKYDKFGEKAVLGNLKPFDHSIVGQYPVLHFAQTTFNPDADPESTSCDGEARRTGSDAAWADARETNDALTADADGTVYYIAAENGGAGSYGCYRQFWLFDTSALLSNAVISETTYFSFYHTAVTAGDNTVGLIQTSPASNTNIVVGDYDALTLDSPDEGATRITPSTSQFNNMVLNATGRGWIDKEGITKLGTRASRDIDDTQPPDSPRQYYEVETADNVSGNDPKLVVDYTLLVVGGNPLFFSSGGLAVG